MDGSFVEHFPDQPRLCGLFFSSFLRWMHVEIKQQRMNMVYLVYPTHSN